VRDSSLSAGTQAVMCAEVGHLELAHDYATEAALIDLHDLHRNSRDGLHMASLAGAWSALVEGFGGLRENLGALCLDPALPSGIDRIAFRLRWRQALADALEARQGDIDEVTAAGTAVQQWAQVNCGLSLAGTASPITSTTTGRAGTTP
jgi:trehalose/maltose hydrolase-like predicted phosphorylase